MKKMCSINSLEGSRRTPLDHPSRCPPPRLETSPTVICVSSFSTRQSLEQKSSPKKRRSWVLKVLEHGSKTYRLHNMHMCVCVNPVNPTKNHPLKSAWRKRNGMKTYDTVTISVAFGFSLDFIASIYVFFVLLCCSSFRWGVPHIFLATFAVFDKGR